MNKIASFIAAAGLAAVSGTASAWWGPFNDGYNGYNNDGLTDMFGDADGGFLFGVTPRPNTKPKFFHLKKQVKLLLQLA